MDDSRGIKHRQIWVTLAAVGSLVSLVILGLYLSDPTRRIEQAANTREVINNYRTPASNLDPSEVWIARSETELQGLKQTNTELRRQMDELRGRLEDVQRQQREGTGATYRDVHVSREAGSRERPMTRALPPPPPPRSQSVAQPLTGDTPAAQQANETAPATSVEATSAVANQRLPPPPPPRRFDSATRSATTASTGAVPGILVVDLTANNTGDGKRADGHDNHSDRGAAGTGKPVTHHVRDFLPAGAFAKAVMLSGLDAPTGGLAKTNPQPVLLRLLDHGTLPNRFRSRVRECFVTAAGFGDLASERAYLRLEKLSCVLRDGIALEVTLKGFVAGEDGKAGLRGRVVSKQGQLIARALVAGVASGIGNGVAQSFTSLSTSALGNVQNIDPGNIAQFGVANGFASALDRIAEWYLERADEVYPVLEVDAGRVVEVVLNEGLELGVDMLKNANDAGGSS